MCSLTYEFNDFVLRGIRKFEKGEMTSTHEKAELLACIKYTQDVLEEFENYLKRELEGKIVKTIYVPNIAKKVQLSEGRLETIFDNEKVFTIIGQENYIKVTNIIKNKLNELNLYNKVLNEAVNIRKGQPFITVSKMNKEELKEHYRFNI